MLLLLCFCQDQHHYMLIHVLHGSVLAGTTALFSCWCTARLTTACRLPFLSLQEHLVGLLMAQQRHNQVMQALAAVIAAAASLLLAAAGAGPLWPVQLVGWVLLAAVVVLVAPRLLEAVPSSIAGSMLGRTVQPDASSLDTCRTLIPQQSNKGTPKLDRVGPWTRVCQHSFRTVLILSQLAGGCFHVVLLV
jgi:hypothetical protein